MAPFGIKIDESFLKNICELAGEAFATVTEMHYVSLLLDGRLQADVKKTKLDAASKKVIQHSKTFGVNIMALIHPAIRSECGSVTLHM